MPQVLKENLERRIRDAALAEFASAGFGPARMGDIARRAGTSAGNVYHYFPSKQALFQAVVPGSLARRLRDLLEERVRASAEQEASRPEAGRAWDEAAEATVAFALEHPRTSVILLGRAAGTPYADLTEEVVGMLSQAAITAAERAGRNVPETLRFDVEQAYRAYVAAWVRILERFENPVAFREALAGYERYHLEGLRALLS